MRIEDGELKINVNATMAIKRIEKLCSRIKKARKEVEQLFARLKACEELEKKLKK